MSDGVLSMNLSLLKRNKNPNFGRYVNFGHVFVPETKRHNTSEVRRDVTTLYTWSIEITDWDTDIHKAAFTHCDSYSGECDLMVQPHKYIVSFSHECILLPSYVYNMHQDTKSTQLIAVCKRTDTSERGKRCHDDDLCCLRPLQGWL